MEESYKVIIAGGRDFSNYDLLLEKCDYYLAKKTNVEVISGGAKGSDKLGERYAKERNLPLKIFLADWTSLGKRAGFVRNVEMAEYADALIAFWDGKSKGTKHMIDLAKTYNLNVKLIKYEKNTTDSIINK
jgi:Ni,Fe-hydrogenase maturation factor